ncbi:MAG: metal ABC transporter permease [Thermomicrobiales bacterium]
MTSDLTIQLIGVLSASACALIGVFLILRRSAMMADAISHAILPGIVLGYFLADGPSLLLGFLGAVLASTLTVTLVAALQRSRKVDENSAIGIVFPAMFALGTVVVSKWYSNVHLDTDAILYGNIEFSYFDRLLIGGRDLGPQGIWIMSLLVVLNLLFLGLFYKELKLTTFDGALAAAIGFSPVVMHYAIMGMLSVTTVGAFTAVGAILVIAMVIVPAATAYLLTEKLSMMLILAVLIGAVSSLAGVRFAIWLDLSVSGSMVMMTGAAFLLALLFSPSQGAIAGVIRRRRQRAQFALEVLLGHLLAHRGDPAETLRSNLPVHLNWPPSKVESLIETGQRRGYLTNGGDELNLTPKGIAAAQARAGI